MNVANSCSASGGRTAARAVLFIASLIVFCITSSPCTLADESFFFEHAVDSDQRLVGIDARSQLLVTRSSISGLKSDVTRDVTFASSPAGLIEIDSDGLVTPLADGDVTVTATASGGQKTQTELTITGTLQQQPVGFRSQVVPILTKLGCNGGGCHGKIAGQNGFRLSLLGFEPDQDYRRLFAESRSRRVSIAAPERSLFLMKTTGEMPHGGGSRATNDSHEYRVLRRWIAQGLPYEAGEIRSVVSIDVTPAVRRMASQTDQQIVVVATYSDGTQEDVTRAAVYESNDTQMAEVSAQGLVSTADSVGDVAVMARYQGHVAVFRAEIPLRLSLPESPEHVASNPVDRWVGRKLHSLGIPASPTCDETTFLRRVTLDLTGRLPTLDEMQSFLDDSSVDKRNQLIDRLLDSEDYASFFAGKWSVILRNRRTTSTMQVSNVLFHQWLKQSFFDNRPYDQIVEELLTASGTVFSHPATSWLSQVTDNNERIEDVSQLFLGQRIQCARCHHHPYEKWSQDDYAKMSAFFTTVSKKSSGDQTSFVTRIAKASAKHPKHGRPVAPAGLDAPTVSLSDIEDPRQTLSDWMTDRSNPFFAKSLVNRYWKHLMGRGLVEPEDDLRVTNPPSNPELMDALADYFVSSGYDLKALIRIICQSQTYQASSDAVGENINDRRSYSRYYPKRMQAETLLDAIDRVTGSKTDFAGMPSGTRAVELPDTGFNSYFLNVFGRPRSQTACECERSTEANLAQSLHLLNSDQMQQKLSGPDSRAATLAKDSDRPVESRLTELYQIAFSRNPSDAELQTGVGYLGDQHDQSERWEDLIWAIVNSKEFVFNH